MNTKHNAEESDPPRLRTELNQFIDQDARNIIWYVQENYQGEPEYVWQGFPKIQSSGERIQKNGIPRFLSCPNENPDLTLMKLSTFLTYGYFSRLPYE